MMWKQHEKYLNRVKIFQYRNSYRPTNCCHGWCRTTVTISPKSWATIIRRSQGRPILPNLLRLEWSNSCDEHQSSQTIQLQLCSAFLRLGLEVLHVKLSYKVSSSDIKKFLRHLQKTGLNIKYLTLIPQYMRPAPSGEAESDLCNMLRALHSLRQITLPGYWMQLPVLGVLSRLPELSSADQYIFTDKDYGDTCDYVSMKYLPLTLGAFSHLETLNLAIDSHNMLKLLRDPCYPRQVKELDLHCPNAVPDHVDIEHILKALCSSCPSLVDLYMDFRLNSHEDGEGEDYVLPPLSSLFPVSGLKTLRTFTFGYPVPLQYDVEDLSNFLPTLPETLRYLNLNAEPFFIVEPLPDIEVLEIFAMHCSRLKSLGFCVYVRALPTLQRNEQPTFNQAVRVDVGMSKIIGLRPVNVARFMREFFPFGCKLSFGMTRYTEIDSHLEHYESEAPNWKFVNEKITKVRALARWPYTFFF
jgi:hypothetical protein